MAVAYPDGTTLTGMATLVGALFAGIVSLINAIASARGRRDINQKLDVAGGKADIAASKADVAAVSAQATLAKTAGVEQKLEAVHDQATVAATNTNGHLTSLMAENRELRDQVTTLKGIVDQHQRRVRSSDAPAVDAESGRPVDGTATPKI